MNVIARFMLALGHFFMTLAGAELKPAQARDHLGRFTSSSGAGVSPAILQASGASHLAEGQVSEPTLSQALDSIGITQRMLRQATPLELPEDIEDIALLSRSLRHWVLRNMDNWVNGRGRSVAPVFNTLQNTWALDKMQYVQRAVKQSAAAPRAGAGPAPARHGEREMVTLRYVKPPQQSAVRAELVSARLDALPPGSLKQDLDCSLAAMPAEPKAWHSADHTELSRPRGSAQSGTDASQGAERPCHSSIRKTGEALRASSYAATSSGCDPAIPDDVAFEQEAGDYVGAKHASPLQAEPEIVEMNIPRYDPTYDVAGNLPKSVTAARCPADYLQGFGNTPQAAEDAYYSRNQAEFKREGMNWNEFGMPCKVYEAYDDQERLYFIARADPYGLLELMKARSEAFQAVAHPVQEDPLEHNGGSTVRAELVSARLDANASEASCTSEEITTKNTKDTKFEEAASTSESDPNLSDLCVLSGNSPSVDMSTTPWKGSLRGSEPASSFNGAAANLEPFPLNPEPP